MNIHILYFAIKNIDNLKPYCNIFYDNDNKIIINYILKNTIIDVIEIRENNDTII